MKTNGESEVESLNYMHALIINLTIVDLNNWVKLQRSFEASHRLESISNACRVVNQSLFYTQIAGDIYKIVYGTDLFSVRGS